MPTQADEQAAAQIAALVAAQAAARAALTGQAKALAGQAARSFTAWYDHGRITEWATDLAKRLQALQRAQAQSTDAYLARALSLMIGGRIRPIGRVNVADLRTGVTHAGAYGRAADTYRWQQSQLDAFARSLATALVDGATALVDGAPLNPEALIVPGDAAVNRVTAVADMDMQLADRAQAHQVLTEHQDRRDIRGYRRVVHPELSKGGTCGLCIAASDRIYQVEDLKAIHGRCECTVLPIVGSLDPGSGLNNLDLKTLYNRAGSTGAVDLKRTRYKIDEHGELGPVLTDGTFRTAKQARRDTKHPQPKTLERTRADIERVLAGELSAQDKARSLAAADPKKWSRYADSLDARIADLRQQLAVDLTTAA